METENKFKNIYSIKSARKAEYDYTNDGWYFVTICAKNMEMFFGNITDGKINLSEIGKIVENYWREIPKHFPFVELDEFSIMPNHTHGIIGINNFRRDVDLSRLNSSRLDSSRLCVANKSIPYSDAINQDAINRVSTTMRGGVTGKNNPMGKNGLGEIIRWYKGRCKFEIGKMCGDAINRRLYDDRDAINRRLYDDRDAINRRLYDDRDAINRRLYDDRDAINRRLYDGDNKIDFAWQPRFYDRIIRNEKELDKIRKYIFENPLKWEFDRNNPENSPHL